LEEVKKAKAKAEKDLEDSRKALNGQVTENGNL
jgi:hypothetical protein